MGREVASGFITESFRCILKSFCASQSTGHRARQRGQLVRARDICNRADPIHINIFKSCHDHCPDLFLGIRSLQLKILATLVMANWIVFYQLDFFEEVRAVDLQSEKPELKSRPDH